MSFASTLAAFAARKVPLTSWSSDSYSSTIAGGAVGTGGADDTSLTADVCDDATAGDCTIVVIIVAGIVSSLVLVNVGLPVSGTETGRGAVVDVATTAAAAAVVWVALPHTGFATSAGGGM
uniref:Uncharacterized protein n=1 Tax=Lygus hesperus TaxID=30085 RepID=A0A146M7U8_LYGHE